jgi:hypothetical protein
MSFPQASDYRPPIIPDGEIYDNPENGKSYYWTQILLPEGSTPDTATSIGGYWTVVCSETNSADKEYVDTRDDLLRNEANATNEFLCAQFYLVKNLVNEAREVGGNSLAFVDYNNGNFKFWTFPLNPTFFVENESYYINNEGPYQITQLNANDDHVAFVVTNAPGLTITPDTYASFSKTRKLCTEINFLQNEIIELEEEIDAIAPSVVRGKWMFNAVGTVANAGQFTMYDAEFGSGQPTGLFKSAKSIWFNQINMDGAPHAFEDVDDGELLEIFVDGSSEYGLYEVVGKAHDETEGAVRFWVIDVNFIRTNELTTAVGPGELCRFKIFMAPTGGDASGFVMKTGDEMTGKLTVSGSDALNLKGKIQVNGTTTNSRFLGTDNNGNTSWKTALTSHVQADWNTTSTSAASYIKNKPSIPSAPTYTITKSGDNYYVS